jgi:4-hydroxy-3-polyprenylbenzoate decarboxylase
MYRMQVYDDVTAGMHWQTHKQGAEHYRRLRHHGLARMDIAVAIGCRSGQYVLGHPAAAARPGRDDDRRLPAAEPGRNGEVPDLDLEVPAQAEIVLEGYVELGELRTEGPFGDHTGFYSLEDQYPVFHLTAITHREKPIYATTIVGPPPMEDITWARPSSAFFCR